MNETTRDIVTVGTWCSELLSFGSGQPATENIRTVEPCQLLAINKQGFQMVIQTVLQFDKVYRQIFSAINLKMTILRCKDWDQGQFPLIERMRMTYWISTTILCIFLLLSAYTYLFHKTTIDGVKALGFPGFFIT